MTISSKITKDILFPLYKSLQGRSFYPILNQLRDVQWMSSEELQARQWQKLYALLKYAYENTQYYRQIFQKLRLTPQDIKTPEDFRKLPYLTRDGIRKNQGGLIVQSQKLSADSTSGSTGESLKFFTTHRDRVMRQSLIFLGMGWAGLDIGDRYAKLLGVMPRNGPSYKARLEDIKDRLAGFIFLSAYDLSEETLPDYVRRLVTHKPKVLLSYPSPLRVLALYLAAHPERYFQLESIVTTSETLFDEDRELFEDVFRCSIFNRYGSREFGNVAHECAHHQGLHILTEHVYLECLRNNEPAPPGEKGELIITSLTNNGLPFIRYRVGDYGELSNELCGCGRGFPLLASVDGRVFDVIVAPNGRYITGTFWTRLFRKTVKGIQQFQLVQENVDTLTAKLVTDSAFQKSSLSNLEEQIQERCGSEMRIKFEVLDEIPLTKAGKRKFVISKVAPDFGNQ